MAPYETCWIPSTGITGLPNSMRLPVTSQNRNYLKLLRKDEEERWGTIRVQEAVASSSLPSGMDAKAEAWLIRIVGGFSLGAVGYAIVDATRLVDSWSALTEWVKFAIGA